MAELEPESIAIWLMRDQIISFEDVDRVQAKSLITIFRKAFYLIDQFPCWSYQNGNLFFGTKKALENQNIEPNLERLDFNA